MKPIIGMNMDISTGPPRKIWAYSTYHESILAAGGIPLLLPPLPEGDLEFLLSRIDGMLLIGGDDYSPSLYNEPVHPTVEIMDSQREQFDLALIKRLMTRRDLPVLGLCGGAQLINIAFGGSLIQDIPTEIPDSNVKHGKSEGWKAKDWHEVQFQPATKLIDIYKKQRLNVPTAHHQGIKSIGKGLKSSAVTDDGIVEALEAPDHRFMIGVQWHPERDLVGNQPLFEAFLAQTKIKNAG